MNNMITTPGEFKPSVPDDFIGPAHKVAALLHRKIERRKERKDGSCIRNIFYGPPGSGKSELAQSTALWATGSPFGITDMIGSAVTVDDVRGWMNSSQTGNMFSAYTAIIIDEVDTMRDQPQVELMKLLDQRPRFHLILMTTNKKLEELHWRFQTRAIPYKVGSPSHAEISDRLMEWVPNEKARERIVTAANGCVRAAMLDAENWMDREEMK
tara:strand:+ start:86 stop:721 length:636 start_codon:yes stop_codon:yes gene_type:complete